MSLRYPPPSPPFIAARHHGVAQKPKAIVLHGTVSSDNAGTARNIAAWWHGPDSPVTSAHYLVDPKEIIQCVGDHTIAYHCGYNTGSIAVEFCDEQVGPATRWQDTDSRAILRKGARLVAQLCLAYDITPGRPSVDQLKARGPHGIYGHNDSRLAFGNTTHTDPRDFPWDQFMRLVRDYIAELKRDQDTLEITIGTMNATPRSSTADIRRFMNAVDVGVMQETGKIMPRVRLAAQETGRKLIVTDNAGALSTPAVYNPKEAELLRELWIHGVDADEGGPFVSKDKGWQGGRFRFPGFNRRIDILGGHLPYNQDDSAASRKAADKMARVLRDYGLAHDDVATAVAGDWNERAKNVPYLPEAGWRCDQIQLDELATHGKHWAPDQAWVRTSDRTRVTFVSHRKFETGGDHDSLIVVLRLAAID